MNTGTKGASTGLEWTANRFRCCPPGLWLGLWTTRERFLTCSCGTERRTVQCERLYGSPHVASWLSGPRSSAPMEHEISFAPYYNNCRETGARPGFLFVHTAKFRAEDCTDGSWEDSTVRAALDQPGDAVNAVCCAMPQKAGRS